MGFLDGLLNKVGGGGGLGGLVSKLAGNPQIASALTGLLSTRDSSVGGSGGLGGIVSAFQEKGMGGMVSSWLSGGSNEPVSADQVSEALGPDAVEQFAKKAGVSVSEAGPMLAGLLPDAVDGLTPDGNVPDTNSLEGSLSSLLSRLGH